MSYLITVYTYASLLLHGLSITLFSWIGASCISLSLGIIVGICRADNNRPFIVRSLCFIYVTLAKGIPAFVHILLAYFVLPSILSIDLSALSAGTLALGLCSGGYCAEIIRSCIQAVPQGQWDACYTLGYTRIQTLVRIILPQAFRHACGPLLGESEQLLKSTSLLSSIGVIELTRAGMNIVSRELNPLEMYLTIAAVYVILSLVMTVCMSYIQKRIVC